MADYNDIDVTIPRDTDPESSLGQVIRDMKIVMLGFADPEHYYTGKHIRQYVVTTGSADAYAVTIAHKITNIDTGFMLLIEPNFANSGAAAGSDITITTPTTTVGPYDILYKGVVLPPNYLEIGRIAILVFDGTAFELLNPPVGTAVTAGDGGAVILANQEVDSFTEIEAGFDTLLGSITVPINDYTNIKVEAAIEVLDTVPDREFGFYAKHEGVIVYRAGSRANPNPFDPNGLEYLYNARGIYCLSHIFAGNQTAPELVEVFLGGLSSGGGQPSIEGKMLHLRVYGY